MKKLVESYLEFLQTAAVAQMPGSFRIYGANPKRAKRIAHYAKYGKTSRPHPNHPHQ